MKGLKIILTLFFVFCTLLFSCEDENKWDCGSVPDYFEIQGLKPNNFKFTNTNYNSAVPTEGSELINWREYFIRIVFDLKYLASKQQPRSGGANLYALTCVGDGHKGSKVGLDTLFVVTLNDYNNEYRANDTINKIVLLNDRESYSTVSHDRFKSLAEYIQVNKNGVLDKTFEIKFNEKPLEASSEQKFKIIYKLKNGNTFEAITEAVKLNNL